MVKVESAVVVRLNVLHPPTASAVTTCWGDAGWRSKSSPSGMHLATKEAMNVGAKVDGDADFACALVSSSAA